MAFQGNFLIIDASGAELFLAAGNAKEHRFFSGNGEARRHSSEILVQTERLLCELGLTPADLDVIGAVSGPGSFTGIRIGVTTANALARATGARLISFTALEAIACDMSEGLSLMDCKHSNYYALLKIDGEERYFAASEEELKRDYPSLPRVFYSAPDPELYIKTFLQKLEKEEFASLVRPFYIKKSSAEVSG